MHIFFKQYNTSILSKTILGWYKRNINQKNLHGMIYLLIYFYSSNSTYVFTFKNYFSLLKCKISQNVLSIQFNK